MRARACGARRRVAAPPPRARAAARFQPERARARDGAVGASNATRDAVFRDRALDLYLVTVYAYSKVGSFSYRVTSDAATFARRLSCFRGWRAGCVDYECSDVRTFGRSDVRTPASVAAPAPRIARRRATDARALPTAPRDRSAMSRAMRGAVRDALRRSLAEKAPHSLRVHMSNKYVYAQIVRALDGHVVASASTIERAFPFAESDASARETTRETRSRSDKRAAAAVGDALARRAKAANVDAVKWTRPYGKRFHGKIASLMEALKSGGVGLL